MRIAILGNSGSGKSTLAQELKKRFCLSLLDLDTVAWEPEKVAVARNQHDVQGDVESFCSKNEQWVIEGCYAALVSIALEFHPFLLFLEPGVGTCISNCRNRPWEPHKYASKCEQDKKLDYLLSWVQQYYSREDDLSLKAHEALYANYNGPKLKITENVIPNLSAIVEQVAE